MITRYCMPLAALLICAVSRASDMDIVVASAVEVPVPAIVTEYDYRMTLADFRILGKVAVRFKSTPKTSPNYPKIERWHKKTDALLKKRKFSKRDLRWFRRHRTTLQQMGIRDFRVASAKDYESYKKIKHFTYAETNHQRYQDFLANLKKDM
jgi:hypothetical protein